MLFACFTPKPVLCEHSPIIWWLKISVVRVRKMNSWPKLQETLESTANMKKTKQKKKTKKNSTLTWSQVTTMPFKLFFPYCTCGSASTSAKLLIIDNQHLFNDNNDRGIKDLRGFNFL